MTAGDLHDEIARLIILGELSRDDPVVLDWPREMAWADLRTAGPRVAAVVAVSPEEAERLGYRRVVRPADEGEGGTRVLKLG